MNACGGSLLLEQANFTGHSFTPALRGEEVKGREQIVLVESTRQCSVGRRTRDWKLIQPVPQTSDGRILPDIYGRPRDEQPLLFDLRSDPNEERNVAREFPDVRDEMLQVLEGARAHGRQASGADPLDYGLSLAYDEFMARSLGRGLRG